MLSAMSKAPAFSSSSTFAFSPEKAAWCSGVLPSCSRIHACVRGVGRALVGDCAISLTVEGRGMPPSGGAPRTSSCRFALSLPFGSASSNCSGSTFSLAAAAWTAVIPYCGKDVHDRSSGPCIGIRAFGCTGSAVAHRICERRVRSTLQEHLDYFGHFEAGGDLEGQQLLLRTTVSGEATQRTCPAQPCGWGMGSANQRGGRRTVADLALTISGVFAKID